MNDPYRTECRAVRELLVALLTGELIAERAALVQNHLAACAACQAELTALRQTQEQAAPLHLESPALDRYPEFLRRLAADDTVRTQQALVGLTAPSIPPIAPSAETEEPLSTPAGLAAVVPLFGRRVLVRNGFGKGFELSVVTGQGQELLRVSATSLTRVAAVAASVSLFAGLSLAGTLLLLFPNWWRSPQEPQAQQPPPALELPARHPDPRLPGGPFRDWLQTISGKDRTLVIWSAGGQLMTSWMEGATTSPPQPLPLTTEGQSPIAAPAETPATGATDGKSFVLVRELGKALYAWHLPVDDVNGPHPALRPEIIVREGVMPALTWVGDRYLLAFVRPSLTEPVIAIRELTRLGQLTEQPEVVAVLTEELDKVGWPALAAAGPRGALFWMTGSGQVQARTLSIETGALTLGPRRTVTHRQRAHTTPLQVRPINSKLGGGYVICWGELDKERFDLKLARLSDQLELQASHTLISAPKPPPAYDWRLNEQGVTLLWLDGQPGGQFKTSRLWLGYFNLDGLPLQPQQPLDAELNPPITAAFADLNGRQLLWTIRQAHDAPVRLVSRALP